MICALLITTICLLCFKNTRYMGYVTALIAWELNAKELGYTETELCLNDIIIILLFILYEVWNKFRKEKSKDDNTDKRADL